MSIVYIQIAKPSGYGISYVVDKTLKICVFFYEIGKIIWFLLVFLEEIITLISKFHL